MSVNIKQRRSELNLTLEQIGNYVGVSKGTVKKWESGDIKNMRRDKILLLSEILRVSPLDFLDITSSETDQSQSIHATSKLNLETVKKIESALGMPLSNAILIHKQNNTYHMYFPTEKQLFIFLENLKKEKKK